MPMLRATTVVPSAISALSAVAAIHLALAKYRAYHRSENPAGGNSR